MLIELPVKARLGKQFSEGFYRKIEDKDGNAICLVVDSKKAPYIVQAINSHEKLVEALRIYGHHGRTDDSTMCEHMKHSDYPCTCGFEQALSEAEKP